MFLYDKYAPKNIGDLTFHVDEVNNLLSMNTNAIPHIILYGSAGSGKRTIARFVLENLYDDSINKLTDIVYTISGSGNTLTDIVIKQSPYHIVIESNNNNFDKYLIQNIVKEYAQRIPMNVFQTNKPFKIVLINDVDNLSYHAQMSLRRTMEKYSKTCRFLMICNAMSRLIDPLKSRCVCVRITSPSNSEIIQTILKICYHEKFDISLENLNQIVSN